MKTLERGQVKAAGVELVSEHMGAGDEKREKRWFDDAIACVFGPLTKVPTSRQDKAVVREMVRTILVFLLQGKVSCAGTLHLKWSSLRKAVRAELIRVHKHVTHALPGIPNPNAATAAEVADALIKLLDEDQISEPLVLEASPEEATILELLENSIFVNEFTIFLQDSFIYTGN